MKYRKIPRTDLNVSVVGFGVWTVSTNWWGVTDTDLRHSLLRDAYHKYGINFFDTSNTYGEGYGETILKETLADHRQDIIIASKFGYDIEAPHDRGGHGERPQNWSPAFIRKSCEQSLSRLGTDYIDLYQMHNCRIDAIESDDVIATLEALKDEGKIRAYGAAMGPKLEQRQIAEGVAASRLGFHTSQIIYNLLEQVLGPENIAAAKEHDAAILVRVPHSSGLLEGNLTEDTEFPAYDHRRHRPRVWLTEGLKKIDLLDFLIRSDRTIGQAALQYIWQHKVIASAFPNIYDHDQLAEFAGAPDTPDLTEEEIKKVDDLYADNFGMQAAMM